MGQDREGSHTNYQHGKNRLNLGKINLICNQSNWSRILRRKPESQNTFPQHSLSAGLKFILHFLSLLPAVAPEEKEMGFTGSLSHSLISATSHRARLHTFFPCSSVGSFPQATVFNQFSQHELFPQTVVLHKLLQENLFHRVSHSGTGCWSQKFSWSKGFDPAQQSRLGRQDWSTCLSEKGWNLSQMKAVRVNLCWNLPDD